MSLFIIPSLQTKPLSKISQIHFRQITKNVKFVLWVLKSVDQNLFMAFSCIHFIAFSLISSGNDVCFKRKFYVCFPSGLESET
ncbi:hypothetical protein CW304_27910 [Bacillus sp. UFRGS-B20]|nr:hypothetical protein CW304_27910 [Bacillus sp. UFRGS-B20]